MGRKVRIGEVISDKMDKTVVVKCLTLKRHPLYKKTLKRHKKLYVHDEGNQCRIGDKVKVMETRPLSKLKRWRVVEILERKKI
jgi:small subunit ribosomal protein S17